MSDSLSEEETLEDVVFDFLRALPPVSVPVLSPSEVVKDFLVSLCLLLLTSCCILFPSSSVSLEVDSSVEL